MKIDDFMNQAESYNTGSDTLTGFFGLNDETAKEKTKKILISAVEEDLKSNVVLKIDAITESKIEAIVLTYLALTHLSDVKNDKQLGASQVALAIAKCHDKGFISDENVVQVLSIFAKIIT